MDGDTLLMELKEHEGRENVALHDVENRLRDQIASLTLRISELQSSLSEMQGKMAGYIVAATVAASAFSTIIMFIAQRVLK